MGKKGKKFRELKMGVMKECSIKISSTILPLLYNLSGPCYSDREEVARQSKWNPLYEEQRSVAK